MGHRYYDPATGRFLTRDPISYAGGINLYAYCQNNPVNLTDPAGLCTDDRDRWLDGDVAEITSGRDEAFHTGANLVGTATYAEIAVAEYYATGPLYSAAGHLAAAILGKAGGMLAGAVGRGGDDAAAAGETATVIRAGLISNAPGGSRVIRGEGCVLGGVSVNVGVGSLEEVGSTSGARNGQWAVGTAEKVLGAGGSITPAESPQDPYHRLLAGLTDGGLAGSVR
ncbi:MAG TPA: RHS repeat-associated core domain-containing protein [Armatimonadota bacterium]|jgi:hypothetical protein